MTTESADASRYVGYVIGPHGLRTKDLGSAPEIDALVTQATASQEPADANAEPRPWQELYKRVWQPFAAELDGATRVYVAADAGLELLSFAALNDGDKWLYERYDEIVGVHSARDLLVADAGGPSRASGPPLIVADPKAPPGSDFASLPGARAEGHMVQERLAGSALLVGDAVDERQFLDARAPRILHVASHAIAPVFSERAPPPEPQTGRGLYRVVAASDPDAAFAVSVFLAHGQSLRSHLASVEARHDIQRQLRVITRPGKGDHGAAERLITMLWNERSRCSGTGDPDAVESAIAMGRKRRAQCDSAARWDLREAAQTEGRGPPLPRPIEGVLVEYLAGA
jgi:hypothetical protein